MPLVSKTFSEIITFTRASTATFFGSTGLLTSAATNAPRFDYNPATLAAQGLLIEEQRVNLVPYSDYFDNAAWAKTNATVNANAITSVTGNVDADKLVENTAAGTHQAARSATKTAVATTYTASIFLKAAERTFASIALTDAGGFVVGACNLSNGASQINGTSGFTGGSISTTLVSNGWYRVVLTATSTADVAINLVARTATAINVDIYTGDGVSGIYLYGAQLEAGSFATSYAPSVNTFTSRASTGSFFDSAGVLQSAAINVARNTYNPANLAAQPFLLLEEARTNSIRNNTMVGAVAGTPGTLPTNWATVLNGLTQTVVGTGTANGINYVDIRLNGTTSSAGSIQIKPDGNAAISAATAQAWAMSSWVALVGGSTANTTGQRFLLNEYSAGPTYLRTSLVASNILANGATLTRISGALTTGASTTIIEPLIVLDANSGAAIDITLRIGLPQLEQGAFATSVIPTSTIALTRSADISSSAQATRAADVASVNTLSPWYNASEGTLFAEGTLVGGTAATFPWMTALVGSNANNDSIGVQWAASASLMRFGIRAGGATQADISGGSAKSANSSYKVAGRYAANNAQAAFDGTLGVLDTAVTVPTIAALSLGGAAGFQPSANMWLRRVTYYPRSLSDAELISLTT